MVLALRNIIIKKSDLNLIKFKKLLNLLSKIKRENEDSSISIENKINENVYSLKIYSLNSKKYPKKMWNAE